VRREDRRPANLLERLVEGRALLGEIADPLQHDEAGVPFVEVEDAGSEPSALSVRTPPMPRMISCWMRVSRSPPYKRAESSRSHGAFSSRSVSRRYSFTRPSAHAPHCTSTVRSPSGTAVMHGLPSGVVACSIGASAQFRRS
jgi:hypothetical protein